MSSSDVSVVLVHGAWADGSSWAKVIGPWRREGVRAVAAPLPLTSFSDDVAALERTLERVAGPVVLVGHAYAGAVIGATRNEKVRALVYVAALGPGRGRNGCGRLLSRRAASAGAQACARQSWADLAARSAFAAAFAQHASAEEQTLLAAVQRPISPACITVPVGRPLWKDRPTWFLVAEEDRMIVPETQRFMADANEGACAVPSGRSYADRDCARRGRGHHS